MSQTRIMAPDAVDRSLAEWKIKLSTLTKNLEALAGHPVFTNYESYVVDGTQPPIGGATAKVLLPALENFRALFRQRNLLDQVIDKAQTLRDQMPKRGAAKDEDLAKISELLEGASIVLGVSKTPLAQRGLLTQEEEKDALTPERMLEAMVTAYQAMRDIIFQIAEVNKVWRPKLEDERRQLTELSKLTAVLGVDAAELTLATGKLDALLSALFLDPLGVLDDAQNDVEPLVQALRTRVGALKQQRDHLQEEIAAGKTNLPQLETLRSELEAVQKEVLDAIFNPPVFPAGEFTYERLRDWLNKIEEEFEHDWQGALKKMSNWSKASQQFKQVVGQAKAGYQALLEERQELKTRLRMYRTTAGREQYQGRTMIEDPGLTEIGNDADQFLARPAQLAEARARVNDFHNRLRLMERWNAEDEATKGSSSKA